MPVIYKYPLRTQSYQEVEMPRGAKVLSAQTQYLGTEREKIVVYAEVVPTNSAVKREFFMVLTGYDVKINGKYIGTCMLEDGTFVAHMYVGREV